MRTDDLHGFITLLEQADELVRIAAQVDPHLEVAAIIDRVSKGAGRGRALLFEQVAGSSLPLAANLFGSLQRVTWALGTTDLTGLAERLAGDLRATGETRAVSALLRLIAAPGWQPVAAAPRWRDRDLTGCGLTALPVLQNWPGDGGRYLTLGQVFTSHPEGGAQNCGMYRIQVVDRYRAAIHWRPSAGGARHLAAWHARGEPMPVAVALGGPPVLTWAAGLPLPEGITELAFAGYLTGRPLAVAAGQESDLLVPATAEIVAEGTIHPGDLHPEGPFGNHTGHYVPTASAPLLRIDRIACRDSAIYPCTLVGPPPMEDLFLAEAAARLLLPLLQHDHPWVREVHMPREGIFHRGGLVAVDSAEDRPLADIARALCSSVLLRDARLLILLDAGEPLRDPARVYWRVINSPDWRTRVLIDPQRLVIDARAADDSDAVRPDPAVLRRVLARWHEYGFED